MNIQQLLEGLRITEANVAAKIKDPKTIKMLGLAVRHDDSIPRQKIAKLGPRPSDEDILELWSELLDSSLSNTDYGDISRDGKFDQWLTRLYINGHVDYEDVNGEGGDALGAWKALSIRNKLKPEDQDFNRFKSLRQIQKIVRRPEYRDELSRIKDAEVIEKHKREKKETTLIDDGRFLVTLPYNYGACYTFNNAAGFNASFCTGSSQGLRWFQRYAPDGPVISVFDKENADERNGKWQMHAPTGQMNNGDQTITGARGDQKFSELFPGLLKKIIAAMKSKSGEIQQNSTELHDGGYDVDQAISDIKQTFSRSYASEEPEPETDDETDAGDEGEMREFTVTLRSTGQSATITGSSPQDVIDRLLDRHPNINPDDLDVAPAP